MKASVTNDVTRRTIWVEVSGVPDIDLTQYYHRTTRMIRPDALWIELTDGKPTGITASGGLVLKSGGASEKARDEKRWYGPRDLESDAPEWVRLIVSEAVHGVTSWRTPDVTDPAEVQAL
ncbi:MAG TPA: hypothetical protein VFU47_04375 [Armatimonadota bacterium]|nr:hypothetical protein [Armatimonadota bacterium]